MKADFKVKIVKCSTPGAWWEEFVGQTIHIFAIDDHGYWTRDTGDMHLSQWINPSDTDQSSIPISSSLSPIERAIAYARNRALVATQQGFTAVAKEQTEMADAIEALEKENARKDRWIHRGASSNPHDHGMVVDKPIKGVPGMAAWRQRTNDEWVDYMQDAQERIKKLEKAGNGLSGAIKMLGRNNPNIAIDELLIAWQDALFVK